MMLQIPVDFSLCSHCLVTVKTILHDYNSGNTLPHRQQLSWKFSNRTLRQLTPWDNLRATLPTIQEVDLVKNRNRYT